MIELIVVAHNLRSAHNVGSLLRTAEGLGAEVILTGYTPYPVVANDSRLPHLAQKISKQISKIALGAELQPIWRQETDIVDVLLGLRANGYVIAGLEQTPNSIQLPSYQAPEKLVIILGREVEGIEADVLTLCNLALEIPMAGQKESYNVVQAAAMAMYHCRFFMV